MCTHAHVLCCFAVWHTRAPTMAVRVKDGHKALTRTRCLFMKPQLRLRLTTPALVAAYTVRGGECATHHFVSLCWACRGLVCGAVPSFTWREGYWKDASHAGSVDNDATIGVVLHALIADLRAPNDCCQVDGHALPKATASTGSQSAAAGFLRLTTKLLCTPCQCPQTALVQCPRCCTQCPPLG